VADLFGQNSYKSLWSNYERMEGFVLVFHLFLYYFVTSSIFKSAKDWKRYFNVSIFASFLASIFAVAQLLGMFTINQGGDRLDATFGNATYFAIYLVFHIFLSLFYIADSSTKKIQKYVYSLVVFLELFVLYFTATRGAILGVIVGLIVSSLYIAFKEKENKLLRKISYIVLVSIFVLVAGFISIRGTDFVKKSPVLSRFATIGFNEIKSQGRYFVWPMAVKGFVERPILGWGQEGFNYVFNKNYDPRMFGQEEWFDRTHNVFLDWLIAGGILGLLAYLSMYAAMLYSIYKAGPELNQTDRAILVGMIAAYVFHNMFVFDNLISYIMFFSVLAFIHSVYAHKTEVKSKPFQAEFTKDQINYIFVPLVALSAVCMVYFINVPAILANQNLIKAMSPQADQKVNYDYFVKAYSYNSFGSDEITEQVVPAALSVAQTSSVELKKLFIDLAEKKLKEKISKTPEDARYLVFAGSFMNAQGRFSDALEYLNSAIKVSPNKQTILYEIGSSYLGMGDVKKMFEYFKKAYDLKPESPESKKLLAIAAIYTRDANLLNDLGKQIDKNSIVNDNRFLKAYSDIGEFNTVIAILNERLKTDPKNIQNRLTLAQVYTTVGQKEKSIQILTEIAKDYPEYKDQIDSYIKQLLN
jgi:O-antigen ligase/tetratricopeptide (TPR) repeat protein